jgi:phosphate transport system permease protein
MNEASFDQVLPAYDDSSAVRLRYWRGLKDRLVRIGVAVGGISVIIALVLIFFYLLYTVLPLFRPAHIEPVASYPVPGGTQVQTLYLAAEEYAELGLRLSLEGKIRFFRIKDGTIASERQLAIEPGVAITSVAAGDPSQGMVALGLANGTALLFKPVYTVTYPDNKRRLKPQLSYPLGETAVKVVDDPGQALTGLTVQSTDEQTTFAAVTRDGRLVLTHFQSERSSLLEDTVSLKRKTVEVPIQGGKITHLALDIEQRELYIVTDDGFIHYYNVANKSAPKLIDRHSVVPQGVVVTSLSFLAGGISILLGDSRGRISQWFPVRDENNKYTLAPIRDFTVQSQAIVGIAPEYFRKGFAAIDRGGRLGIYHTTAHRTLLVTQISAAPLTHAAITPRADAMLLFDQAGQAHFLEIYNEHPEVSWRSLWGRVWYESREQPEFIWQSSSATSDFEPKFSLTPLTFGTFKAALYAMIFAIPLAIMGAIYTGYFMSPRMRGLVKPILEIMGALPSVILGFLAGLWLAPLVEQNLPGIFALLFLLPPTILFCAYLWTHLPAWLRHRVPEGWEAALLIPVVCLIGFLAMEISKPLELMFFNGDMPGWLTHELGITYDQRNSLVVGIAIGFAVIPPIFTISEDAIFGVPKHLTIGSLALGATLWQTLVRVVLLTASPGIFSAIMMGLGRAVGETMIVLMATGNTPIMDLNLFQGFRALSANIAVEMPESEVGSTHFRILFLAALVLFIVTFIFNTAAEIVRQRLREKYSHL